MKKYWEKHWAVMTLASIVVLVLIPLGIAFMLSFQFIVTDTSNEWIGFWGGYLGAIIGGIITLYVMKCTLEDGKQARKRDERIQYFNNIITVFADYAQACSKLCKVLLQSLDSANYQKYMDTIEAGNDAAKKGIELDLLISTRDEMYDLEPLKSIFEETDKLCDNLTDMYINIYPLFLANDQGADRDLLRSRADELINKINQTTGKIRETVKKNID